MAPAVAENEGEDVTKEHFDEDVALSLWRIRNSTPE